MIQITSTQNKWYKLAVQLQQKKGRDKNSAYLLEGFRYIMTAIDQSCQLSAILVESQTWDSYSKEDQMTLDAQGHVLVMDLPLFKDVSDTHHSQGITAIVEMKRNGGIEDVLKRQARQIIYLDRLQDPGNLGTIIRTADAAGITDILLSKGSVDPYNPKVIRSTAGSILNVHLTFVESDDVIDSLKAFGYHLLVTALDASHQYQDINAYGHYNCLVIGNEANGVSQSIMQKADSRVIIPIWGKAESLNASIAAGIMMYKLKEIEDLL